LKNEKEIIRLFQDGDEDAVKVIFNEYYEGLCLYAESIIKNHQVAEEIVEDLYVYLWLHARTITFHVSIKSYLYRSTHNNCLKYLDKLKTENKRAEKMHYTLKDNAILHPVSSFQPLSKILVRELETKAEQILNSLPEQCRKIYSLNRYDNLNYSEIANKLNLTVGTVKTQMSRAFKRFREDLKDYFDK
jgi:RNA polymerase sigma-70 factor (ECF subfamily)